MNKEEYYDKSKLEKVVKKCPIYDRCQRCAYTLFFLSGLHLESNSYETSLSQNGLWELNGEDDLINQIGNVVEIIGGDKRLYINNGCPEVPLFATNINPNVPKKSIIEGSWDSEWKEYKYGDDGKFKVIRVSHFTECREYLKFNSERVKYKEITPPQLYVYLMKNNSSGYYKIGRSVNPKYRERTLQSKEPNIELLDCWLVDKDIEINLHKEFAEKRVRGEWFNLSSLDLEKIDLDMKKYLEEANNKTLKKK